MSIRYTSPPRIGDRVIVDGPDSDANGRAWLIWPSRNKPEDTISVRYEDERPDRDVPRRWVGI
jgi:hypothetical protein